jgi:hypothetical protein
MTKLFLLPFLTLALYSSAQNSATGHVNQDSISFVKKCIAFIKEVKAKELSDTNFILEDKPFSFEHLHCLDYLLKDSSSFTKDELSLIRGKKYPSVNKWTKKDFENIRLVSRDTINAVFRDLLTGWENFFERIGRSIHTFSVPIFLKNNTYCLFYSDNSCGELCGEGRLVLYKKEKNKWIEVETYCYWIS